jgi:Ca2+/H+ antiporter
MPSLPLWCSNFYESVLYRLDPRYHPPHFAPVMLTMSRWISLTLFSVFMLKLWFQLRTHFTLFNLTDREETDSDDDNEATEPPLNILACGLVSFLVFLALMVCASNLVISLSPLSIYDPGDSAESKAHNRLISFVFFTFLPIILEIPGGLKCISLAVANRMDWAGDLIRHNTDMLG